MTSQPLASLSTSPVIVLDGFRILRFAIPIAVAMLCVLPGLVPDMTAADDSYIAGYAAAVLHNEFQATKASVLVHNGVVTVDAQSLGTVDQAKVRTALESIPGVTRVDMQEGPVAVDFPASSPP